MSNEPKKSLMDVVNTSNKVVEKAISVPQKPTLMDVAAKSSKEATKSTKTSKSTLVDIAKIDKPTLLSVASTTETSTLASVAAVHPRKSLADTVREQASESLVNIANNLREDKSSSFGKTVNLVDVAATVEKEKSIEIKKALNESKFEVKKENDQEAATSLSQTVQEVRKAVEVISPNEAKATLIACANEVKAEQAKVSNKPKVKEEPKSTLKEFATKEVEVPPSPRYSEDDFVEEKPKQKKSIEVDNQSDAESENNIERTTPSTDGQQRKFLIAVYRGQMNKVRDMLSSGDVDVHATDQHGWNGLHWAASQGHGDILNFLLKSGAAVHTVEPVNLWSPLHLAVIRGHLAVAKLLLNNGAKKTQQDVYGDRPIDCIASTKGARRKQFLELFEIKEIF